MRPEPTEKERQHEAFALLKSHANRAHQDGDGLLSASLSETALQEISRLISAKRLLLPLRELQWAMVFQMYWLLHKQTLNLTHRLLNTWPCQSDDDRAVREILLVYLTLLSEPFLNGEDTIQKLDAIPLSAFGSDATPETAELARHFIELAWFHSNTDGRWKAVLTKWLSHGPAWMKIALEGFDERLQLQSRLTCPSSTNRPLPESDARRLADRLPIASLWIYHLYGNRDEIDHLVASQLSQSSGENPQWRIIADFAHMNFTTLSGGDSIAAWIARRRSMTLKFPLLVFNDRREVRMSELLLAVFRKGKLEQGFERQEIYQLAMLHELAALRIWDYSMWAEATRVQSEVSLEAAQWSGRLQGMFAVNGLVNGIRSSFLEPQSRLLDKTIESLEFAAPEHLRILAEVVLETYPRQQRPIEMFLIMVADLFPEDFWAPLAQWTIDYGQNFTSRPFWGMRRNILEHWRYLIPSLPASSTAWRTLQSIVLNLGRSEVSWRDPLSKNILWSWLVFAPLDLSVELGRAIAAGHPTAPEWDLARAQMLAQAEEVRPDLGHQFTTDLFSDGQDSITQSFLAAHLSGLSEDLVRTLRARIEGSTEQFLAQAVPPAGALRTLLGGAVLGFDIVPRWTDDDLPLLERLISATNSPDVSQPFIPNLLNMMQLMAAFGSERICHRLLPEIRTWMERPPSGRSFDLVSDASTPFDISHLNLNTLDMDFDLGWLIFQMVRKLGSEAQQLALDWTKKTMLAEGSTHLPIAFRQNLVIATKGESQTAQQALHNLEAILLRLRIQVGAHEESGMIGVIDYMAEAMTTTSSEQLDWSTESGRVALRFVLNWCSENLDWLSKKSNPSLRTAIGNLTSALFAQNTETDSFEQVRRRLSSDNRARVRFAAKGGWTSLRT